MADLSQRGIVMTGRVTSTVSIVLATRVGIEVIVAEDPVSCCDRYGYRAGIMDVHRSGRSVDHILQIICCAKSG